VKASDKTPEQKLAFLTALFAGLQKEGFRGVVHIHLHDGGVRGIRKEEAIDLDW
jgi:hypothetical protein